jgi:phage shock protein PspC (stress-responsive transcriptional regulator)
VIDPVTEPLPLVLTDPVPDGVIDPVALIDPVTDLDWVKVVDGVKDGDTVKDVHPVTVVLVDAVMVLLTVFVVVTDAVGVYITILIRMPEEVVELSLVNEKLAGVVTITGGGIIDPEEENIFPAAFPIRRKSQHPSVSNAVNVTSTVVPVIINLQLLLLS